jgi:hypothetical protein
MWRGLLRAIFTLRLHKSIRAGINLGGVSAHSLELPR